MAESFLTVKDVMDEIDSFNERVSIIMADSEGPIGIEEATQVAAEGRGYTGLDAYLFDLAMQSAEILSGSRF